MALKMHIPCEGGCRCGAIRFRVTLPPLLAMACHCTGCQRMTASAFSLSLALPADGFHVIQGKPAIGGIHGPTRHYHCAHCKSWLFTRPEGDDPIVNVRAPMLDDHEWFKPFVETWTSEKLRWASTPAVHSYLRSPNAADWKRLTDAYQARPR